MFLLYLLFIERLPEESTSMLGQKNELLRAAADQSQEQISNLEHEKVWYIFHSLTLV